MMESRLISSPPPRRGGAAVALVAVACAVSLAACAREAALPPITPAAHQAAWKTWKASRTAWLATPGKALSFTGLRWIREGATTIGAETTNGYVLKGRAVPPVLGTLFREGHNVRFVPAAAGSGALIDSVPATARRLFTDADTNKPSRVDVGSAGFRIVRRVDSVGVRSFDIDKADPKTMEPLTYFPLDPAWRVAGVFTPLAKPDTQAFATTAGVGEIHIALGTVTATLAGVKHEFLAMAGSNPLDLYFTFSDETSGEETYGFRFVHAAIDTATKVVTFDMNFAYNPDCAFSKFTTCPLPPLQNRVPVRITAGEKMAKHVAEPAKSAQK